MTASGAPGAVPAVTAGPGSGRLRSDALGRFALAVVLTVTALSVARAFGPMTYDQDIWRQADTAGFARFYAENGMQLLFPQVAWGGAGPGYVESELPIMPWLAGAAYLVLGVHPVIGRLISLAFMLVATAAFWSLAARRLDPVAARWALIFFALSPVFARYASAFMPEATALCFAVLALWAFDRWLESRSALRLGAAAASTAAAGLAKPPALLVMIAMLVWLLLSRPRPRQVGTAAIAGVAALVPVAAWLWHAHGLYVTFGNTFGVLGDGDDKFGGVGHLLSADFVLGNAKTEAKWVLAVVGVPVALIGFVTAVRRKPPDGLLVGGAVALAVMYAVTARYSQAGMGIQYHVYSLPFAAISVGCGVAWLAERTARIRRYRRTVLAGLLAVAMSVASLQVYRDSAVDAGGAYAHCAAALDTASAPDDLVAVATTSPAVDDGVPNNWQEPMIFYDADRRGWSIAADQLAPAVLDTDHQAGARWFVVADAALLDGRTDVAAWLAAHASQVRTAAVDGCSIWQLR